MMGLWALTRRGLQRELRLAHEEEMMGDWWLMEEKKEQLVKECEGPKESWFSRVKKEEADLKRARMLKILRMNQGLTSAGLLVLILAAAVISMGQGLPKGPVWDKGALPGGEAKQSKRPAASGGVESGSAGIEVRKLGGVTQHKTIKEALATAGSSQATLRLSPGNWVIPEDLVFPQNITLGFERGAILSVGTGVKVTINSEVEAGFQQIFSGPGRVEGNIRARFIYPQWWGALGDGLADDYEAIAAAAHAARGKVLYFKHGTYLTSQMIVLPEQIFVDADPGTIIKAGKSMQAVMTADVAQRPDYGAQQFSLRNLRIDGNKLADNCIYLYKISMNNFDALDGVSTSRHDLDTATWNERGFASGASPRSGEPFTSALTTASKKED